ncbi:MAG: hypothetical protein AAFQ63_22930 [Cyanobacteria bacterium J06621_11]
MSSAIGFFFVALAISIGGGYLLARKVLGPQAARRNTLYAIPWMLVGALLAFLFSVVGSYALVSIYMLYATGVLIWLASWPLRKQQAGKLLIRVDETIQTKIFFFIGLWQVGVAIALTLSQLDLFTGALVTTGGIVAGVSKLLFWWTIAILFLAIGQSNLELHEQGLTYFFTWQPWVRIVAFGWDDDKPNTLILKTKPRTVVSRKYITLSIPTAQVEAVDRFLEDYLLETDLAAEMDGETLS